MTMGGFPLALPLSSGTFNPSSRRTGVCKFFNAQKVRSPLFSSSRNLVRAADAHLLASQGFGFVLDDNAQELSNDEGASSRSR